MFPASSLHDHDLHLVREFAASDGDNGLPRSAGGHDTVRSDLDHIVRRTAEIYHPGVAHRRVVHRVRRGLQHNLIVAPDIAPVRGILICEIIPQPGGAGRREPGVHAAVAVIKHRRAIAVAVIRACAVGVDIDAGACDRHVHEFRRIRFHVFIFLPICKLDSRRTVRFIVIRAAVVNFTAPAGQYHYRKEQRSDDRSRFILQVFHFFFFFSTSATMTTTTIAAATPTTAQI